MQSQVIDWLRFPLVVAVVFIHSSFGLTESIQGELELPPPGIEIHYLVQICCSHVITHIAVPTFFLISGFLFFLRIKKWDAGVYFGKIKKRFHTLLIPYILWNLLALAVTLLYIGISSGHGGFLSGVVGYLREAGWLRVFWDVSSWTDSVDWLGRTFTISAPIDLPLWFLRDLILLSLLTPFIYWFVKYTRQYGIVALAVAYISGIWPMVPGLPIVSVFFFTAGAYLSLYGKNIVTECRRVKTASYILAIAMLIPSIWFDGRNTPVGNFIYPFYVLSGVVAVINLAAKWLECGRVKVHPVLSGSSFFIYAAHMIAVLGVCRIIMGRIIPWENPFMLTIRYFMVPLTAVAVCLCVYVLMRRFMPRLLDVFTGNR